MKRGNLPRPGRGGYPSMLVAPRDRRVGKHEATESSMSEPRGGDRNASWFR